MMTSDREAEMVALQFVASGYHAAVLRYSVTPSVFPTAILELGKSISIIRQYSEQWHVDADKIAVIGFSAGGHLTASYCCFWNKPFVAETLNVDSKMLRPNAMLLGYPVITTGEFAHCQSIKNLLGARYEELKESMSLENQISADVPRSFIWHTFGDTVVSVKNSLLLTDALVSHKIPVEFHLFEKGDHGLALANRLTEANGGFGIEKTCQSWIELARTWLENWNEI